MVDGAAFLAISMMNMNSLGAWSNELNEVGTNLLDGGAHFYGIVPYLFVTVLYWVRKVYVI